jgi:hypothetical protein
LVGAKAVEVPTTDDDEHKGRQERDSCREQRATEAGSRVPDDGDREHHWTGRDLPQRHGVQELGIGHPVMPAYRIGLHQRDDHESAPVREGAYLQRYPHHRDGEGAEREICSPSNGGCTRRARRRAMRCRTERAVDS